MGVRIAVVLIVLAAGALLAFRLPLPPWVLIVVLLLWAAALLRVGTRRG